MAREVFLRFRPRLSVVSGLVGGGHEADLGGEFVEELLDTSAWAKTVPLRDGAVATYPLICHLLDAALGAMALWDRYLTSSQRRVIARGLGVDEGVARSLMGFWAGMHDLGKPTPGFQQCHDGAWARVSGSLRSSVGSFAAEPPRSRGAAQCRGHP